jgi:hypothetical protein
MKSSDKPYDNAARLLANNGAQSLCRWLGAPTNEPRLIAAELPSSTVYPDVVLELRERFALHVEFQTHGASDIPLRVLEYTARLRRLAVLKGYSIRHQVVVLGEGYADDHVHDDGLRFHFHVRYLRDEDPGPLLSDPALAPFASLADVPEPDRQEVLLRAARIVLADGRPELLHAARDLAHIRLDSSTIDEVWKELPMPIPTSEQYRYEEGRAEGERHGRSEGMRDGIAMTIGDALTEKFGEDSRIPLIVQDLAKAPDGWFKRVLAADSLDDLW